MWLRVFKNWACCQKWLTSNSMNGSFLFAHTRDLNAGSWNFMMRSTGIDTSLDPSLRPQRLESWSLNQSMQLKRQSTRRRTLSQVALFWAGVIIRTAPTETKTRVGSQGWDKDKDLFEIWGQHIVFFHLSLLQGPVMNCCLVQGEPYRCPITAGTGSSKPPWSWVQEKAGIANGWMDLCF